MKKPTPLRLFAEDGEGLNIISSMAQDGLTKMNDLNFDRKQRRFSLEFNRFHWEILPKSKSYFRSRSLLAIDSVLEVRVRNLPAKGNEEVLSLLAITQNGNANNEDPAGLILLQFSNGGEIELKTECVDLSLLDTNASWPTLKLPKHNSDSKKA